MTLLSTVSGRHVKLLLLPGALPTLYEPKHPPRIPQPPQEDSLGWILEPPISSGDEDDEGAQEKDEESDNNNNTDGKTAVATAAVAAAAELHMPNKEITVTQRAPETMQMSSAGVAGGGTADAIPPKWEAFVKRVNAEAAAEVVPLEPDAPSSLHVSPASYQLGYDDDNWVMEKEREDGCLSVKLKIEYLTFRS